MLLYLQFVVKCFWINIKQNWLKVHPWPHVYFSFKQSEHNVGFAQFNHDWANITKCFYLTIKKKVKVPKSIIGVHMWVQWVTCNFFVIVKFSLVAVSELKLFLCHIFVPVYKLPSDGNKHKSNTCKINLRSYFLKGEKIAKWVRANI